MENNGAPAAGKGLLNINTEGTAGCSQPVCFEEHHSQPGRVSLLQLHGPGLEAFPVAICGQKTVPGPLGGGCP